MSEMYAYICVICNRNLDKMTETVSALTWFEEWVLYLQVMLLNVHQMHEDYKHEVKYQNILKVFDHKLTLVLACWASWPTYASYLENMELKK